MSYLAVQCLTFQYDDATRGHPHATERARVRGLTLPERPAAGVRHGWRVDRRQRAESEVQSIDAVDPRLMRGLRVDGDELVFLQPPAASEYPWKPVLHVPRGAWGRVTSNAKCVHGDHKWLEEYVVNAGWFDGPPPADVFLGEPRAAVDARRDFLRNGYL